MSVEADFPESRTWTWVETCWRGERWREEEREEGGESIVREGRFHDGLDNHLFGFGGGGEAIESILPQCAVLRAREGIWF